MFVGVLILFVYALVGVMVGLNDVCSSGFGWSRLDRCDVELFALRRIARDLSTVDSV